MGTDNLGADFLSRYFSLVECNLVVVVVVVVIYVI